MSTYKDPHSVKDENTEDYPTEPSVGTPEESENSVDADGFGYSATETFIQSLSGLVNQTDVANMIRAQKQMLQRFEKTNEMLFNCNALSQSRHKSCNEDFKKHVKVLSEMKKDLDYTFRKIRTIKKKLSEQYPIAFAEAQHIQRTTPTEGVVQAVTTTTLSSVNNPMASNMEISKKANTTTVEYVQMEEAVENGRPIENELIKRVCSIESTNPNDSSDCTSEDTG